MKLKIWGRRIFLDLLLCGVFWLVTIPLTLVLAAGSALRFRAWPIFTQTRLGRHGEPFRFAKIRSLPADTPKYATKYELADLASLRPSRYGGFLRTTHLDELPQLALVIMGKMSLVGPRPEMAIVAETFDPVFVEHRLRMRPGCTGLWQISSAAAGLIGEAPEYDFYYSENFCVRLDLWVLWRTAVQLIPGTRKITLADIPRWTRVRSTASLDLRTDHHVGERADQRLRVAPDGVD